MVLVDEIRRALGGVAFPGFPHDVLRYGIIEKVEVDGGTAVVRLRPNTRDPAIAAELRRRIASAVLEVEGVASVEVAVPEEEPATGNEDRRDGLPGVRRILAVSSAKGGVGKSTVAVNLALSLRSRGLAVGLLDADVYGPSVPMMTGTSGKPYVAGNRILPVERHGIAIMSMGFFLDERSPVVWRGPMVMSAIRQFLRDVEWGELDVLVVDMPPGTGDAALTLAQEVPLAGALIVTTPQDVALRDVERGIAMFRQLQVPVLGVVANMSHYVCPDCGERDEIFGHDGGRALAQRAGVPFLADLPLLPDMRSGGDSGNPFVLQAEGHPVGAIFSDLASRIDRMLGTAA